MLLPWPLAQTFGFWTEGKKMKETAEDKYIHFRTISNNICIPDLLTHRGILTLHNELVKILKLPLQGLDQKPTQSPAIKENKHGILVNGLCLYPICRNSRSYWPILGHYPPVMLSGRLRASKKANSRIINNLWTSNVRFLRENRSIRQGLVLRFSP